MEFKQATVIKKANVYFDGQVTSRTVKLASGERVTLGFMLAGSHTFETAAAEAMEVLAGSAKVRVAGEEDFKTYEEGQTFYVKENSSFEIIIDTYLDYCCSYED